jgi:hypothetical protein
MKIPKDIKGRNKCRDAAIVLLSERDLWATDRIAERYHITQRRVEQIVRLNYSFVGIDEEYEKRKRIKRLKVEISNKTRSNKDVADLLEQLRKEIEGDRPLIDQSQHTHYTVIWENNGKSNQVQPSRQSVESLAR